MSTTLFIIQLSTLAPVVTPPAEARAAHPAGLPGPTPDPTGPTPASAAMTDQWWTPADPV